MKLTNVQTWIYFARSQKFTECDWRMCTKRLWKNATPDWTNLSRSNIHLSLVWIFKWFATKYLKGNIHEVFWSFYWFKYTKGLQPVIQHNALMAAKFYTYSQGSMVELLTHLTEVAIIAIHTVAGVLIYTIFASSTISTRHAVTFIYV